MEVTEEVFVWLEISNITSQHNKKSFSLQGTIFLFIYHLIFVVNSSFCVAHQCSVLHSFGKRQKGIS